MKKLLLAAVLPLALCSCASVATPERCEDALRAAATAERIAAVLVNNGYEAKKAAEIARAIAIGKVAVAAACAAAEPS